MAQDIVARGMAGRALGLGSGRVLQSISIPSGLTWDQANFPLTVSLYDSPAAKCGVVSYDPTTHPDYVACKAATPIYVATTGNDTTGNGTSGAPYAGIRKAVQVANAAERPAYIKVAAGTYAYAQSFDGSTAQPAVPTLFEAYNGRVYATTRSGALTFTNDATFTNTYTYTDPSPVTARIFDRQRVGPDGGYLELTNVATAAICNATPNSWAVVAGTVYVHRADGTAPTSSNTYAYLATGNFRASAATQVSLFLMGATSVDGFDVEGGNTSPFRAVYSSTASGTKRILYAKNCSFRYGGTSGVVANGVSVDGLYGLAMFDGCDASFNNADGFNFHDAIVGGTYALTVNCSGTGAGAGFLTSTSNNGWTSHDAVVGVDVAGRYRMGKGASVHSINTAKTLCVGTLAEASRGDKMAGGGFEPTEFKTSDTAKMWLDRVEAQPASASAYAIYAGDTSAIYTRNVWPGRGGRAADASATMTTY